jgi:hypothetical protein
MPEVLEFELLVVATGCLEVETGARLYGTGVRLSKEVWEPRQSKRRPTANRGANAQELLMP